jgi:hypothetical protein
MRRFALYFKDCITRRGQATTVRNTSPDILNMPPYMA